MLLEVVEPDALLVGAAGEFQHPVADGVACCFVAGDHEQNEETAELLAGHALAVDLGVHHHGCEVVGGVLQAGLAELLGVRKNLECHFHQVLERPAEVRVARPEDHVGPVENLLGITARYAHHVADDLQWERGSECFHEVELVVAVLLEYIINERASLFLHVLLYARDFLRGESLRNDGSQAEVLRVIHVDHRSEEFVQFRSQRGDVGALSTAPQLRIATDRPDVLVLGERVVTRTHRKIDEWHLLEELDGGFSAQRPERRFAVLARGDPKLRVRKVN